jgi:hypothetical protein
MDPADRASPSSPSPGALLSATATQLRSRRDDLEPLVAEYDRVLRIADAVGEVPSADAEEHEAGSVRGLHAELVARIGVLEQELQAWAARIQPLVQEYDQILHVLAAYESAAALATDGRAGRLRLRTGRPSGRRPARSAAAHARLEELRGALDQPRTRAELAELMGLSPSRITELLEPLAVAGEVLEIRDPQRPTRKLWRLAPKPADGGGPDPGAADAEQQPA